MNNVITQKNANRTSTAGMQSMARITKNACRCSRKRRTTSMDGIKRTKVKIQIMKTLRPMVNIAKVD
jgi:hypothetical protein